jgi:hypothetical protein
MATKKHKKLKHRMRNAAPAPAVPRARVVSLAGKPANDHDSPSWQVAKIVGGAVGTSLACAFVARQDWIPPKALTGGVSAVGAALMLGTHNPTWRALGAGALASAGGQFTYLMLDDAAQIKRAAQQVASNTAPSKKPANAEGLPPGALEAAYERARRRMALMHQPEAA